MTEVIKLDPRNCDVDALRAPAAALADGALVAFPTETVYGIGANAHNPDAVNRLLVAKNRPKGKPLSLHIADVGDLGRYVDDIPDAANRLIARYWPGPLTIIFPGNAGQGVGIRLPAHPIARALIQAAGCPVVAPSANRAGGAPSISAEQVLAAFPDGELDWVIDCGPTPIKQSSTVVRVHGRTVDILREGIINADMILRRLPITLLFVCTGNSCRSPLAEVLAKKHLAETLGVGPEQLPRAGFRVQSAGTAALRGGHASTAAVQVAAEWSCDLSRHAAQPVTRELAEESSHIFVMNHGHREILAHWLPEIAHKVELLDSEGIADPIGGSLDTYRSAAKQIDEAVRRIARRALAERE